MYKATELMLLADSNGDIKVSVDSSYIEEVNYNVYSRQIGVIINGSEHYYYRVAYHSFLQFVNSESKGQFYNCYVKGRW